MTALEERLSKTEYIYVLGFDGKPQMPTRRKRHVLKLLKTGRAPMWSIYRQLKENRQILS